MRTQMLSQTGDEIGMVDLPDSVFAVRPSHHAVYEVVRAHLANRRQGTASTKGRSEVNYGGRKPWRQKGTGRARAGSRRSPLWVGGGTVFGPKPRCYRLKINRKLKSLALRSALSIRASEGRVTVVDDLVFDEPKTSKMAEVLSALRVEAQKCLLILGHEPFRVSDPGQTGAAKNVLLTEGEFRELEETHGPGSFHVQKAPYRSAMLSASNIPYVRTILSKDVSTYDVMWCERVVLTMGAVKRLQERLEA